MSANFYELLVERFEQAPDATAIEIEERGNWTYSELVRVTERFAALLDTMGIEPGDRVAVQTEKSPEAVFLYLACLRNGAVFLPLNTAYPAAELEFFLSDSEPRILVCNPLKLKELEPLASHLGIPTFSLDTDGSGTLAGKLKKEDPRPLVSREGSDLAAIIYTSGTTGRSKGAMITHDNLSTNARTLHRQWGFVPGDVLLHSLPIYHVHGLFVAMHCALLNTSKIIWLNRFDAAEVNRRLADSTVFMGVPTHYTRLLAEKSFGPGSCSLMRLFVSGSAPLLPETFDGFRKRTGHTILERYGMTEAGMITSNPLDGERRSGTVGFPLADISARVCGDKGRELKNGEIGILEIKGPNVFRGYWKLPQKTREEFREDGFFITGDLAVRDERGYISIVGRGRDLVISGGLNVYPKEIEERLDQANGVVESAVFGLPHDDLGEAVTAVVVWNADRECDERNLIAELRHQLAGFKLPKRILPVKELPRNSMGKVQKNVLRLNDGYDRLEKFEKNKVFYPVPSLYGNDTALGFWVNIGNRYGSSNNRNNSFLPFIKSELNEEPFGFQRVFLTGVAPMKNSIHEEPQFQTTYSMKSSYVHFSLIVDASRFNIGQGKYKWAKDEMESHDDRVNEIFSVSGGFDYGAWGVDMTIMQTAYYAVRHEDLFHKDDTENSWFGIFYQDRFFKLEFYQGQGSDKKPELIPLKDGASPWEQAYIDEYNNHLKSIAEFHTRLNWYRLNVELFQFKKLLPRYSLIWRGLQFERKNDEINNSGAFSYASDSLTNALYFEYPLNFDLKLSGYLSFESVQREFEAYGNAGSESKIYPKAGLSTAFLF